MNKKDIKEVAFFQNSPEKKTHLERNIDVKNIN